MGSEKWVSTKVLIPSISVNTAGLVFTDTVCGLDVGPR